MSFRLLPAPSSVQNETSKTQRPTVLISLFFLLGIHFQIWHACNTIWNAFKTWFVLRLDSFVSGSGGGDKAAGWWVRGSEYLRKRVRRAVYDEESGEIVGAEDGEIVGWLPLEVADFVSEFFKKPAALWHMVYDNVAVGEVSLSPLSLSLLSIPPLSLTPSFPPRACVRTRVLACVYTKFARSA